MPFSIIYGGLGARTSVSTIRRCFKEEALRQDGRSDVVRVLGGHATSEEALAPLVRLPRSGRFPCGPLRLTTRSDLIAIANCRRWLCGRSCPRSVPSRVAQGYRQQTAAHFGWNRYVKSERRPLPLQTRTTFLSKQTGEPDPAVSNRPPAPSYVPPGCR